MSLADQTHAYIPHPAIKQRRHTKNPARSSSISLTTVTGVTGFFSFLSTAMLLSGMI